jgi:hypothetical protein
MASAYSRRNGRGIGSARIYSPSDGKNKLATRFDPMHATRFDPMQTPCMLLPSAGGSTGPTRSVEGSTVSARPARPSRSGQVIECMLARVGYPVPGQVSRGLLLSQPVQLIDGDCVHEESRSGVFLDPAEMCERRISFALLQQVKAEVAMSLGHLVVVGGGSQ